MIETGVFHNGASDLPVTYSPDGVALNDGYRHFLDRELRDAIRFCHVLLTP